MTTTPELPELLKCPFCKRVPTIRQWPGRELKILAHKCQIVDYDVCGFPKDMPAKAMVWNKHIEDALAALAVTKQEPVNMEAVLLLLNHIEDVVDAANWEKIDVKLWNAVTRLAAPQPAQPSPCSPNKQESENQRTLSSTGESQAQPAAVPAEQALEELAQSIERLFSPTDELDAKYVAESIRAWKSRYAAQPSRQPTQEQHCPDCAKPTAEGHIHTCSPQVGGAVKDELTAAVDAAMVEMANIHPPLRRSECERLIRAALANKEKE